MVHTGIQQSFLAKIKICLILQQKVKASFSATDWGTSSFLAKPFESYKTDTPTQKAFDDYD